MLCLHLHSRSHEIAKEHERILTYEARGRRLEFIVRAQQEGFLRVPVAVDAGDGARDGRRRALLQRGLLGVLLVGRREVVNGVLDHVARVHRLLQAAGDALHRGAAACAIQSDSWMDNIFLTLSWTAIIMLLGYRGVGGG